MSEPDYEAFGPLLHGTARAWRLKLDERLKPMGLSQAKWRTLLHRLENEGWVARKNALHDRRCKTVHLAPRAKRVIEQISSTAFKLRHELLDDISPAELHTCIRILNHIRQKAEKGEGNGKAV